MIFVFYFKISHLKHCFEYNLWYNALAALFNIGLCTCFVATRCNEFVQRTISEKRFYLFPFLCLLGTSIPSALFRYVLENDSCNLQYVLTPFSPLLASIRIILHYLFFFFGIIMALKFELLTLFILSKLLTSR